MSKEGIREIHESKLGTQERARATRISEARGAWTNILKSQSGPDYKDIKNKTGPGYKDVKSKTGPDYSF